MLVAKKREVSSFCNNNIENKFCKKSKSKGIRRKKQLLAINFNSFDEPTAASDKYAIEKGVKRSKTSKMRIDDFFLYYW
jgi:hypothetical protein